MTTKRLRKPQPCRYCGFVSLTHAREGRGGAAASVVSYSCRNADECGARLRARRVAKGLPPVDDDGLPF